MFRPKYPNYAENHRGGGRGKTSKAPSIGGEGMYCKMVFRHYLINITLPKSQPKQALSLIFHTPIHKQ